MRIWRHNEDFEPKQKKVIFHMKSVSNDTKRFSKSLNSEYSLTLSSPRDIYDVF